MTKNLLLILTLSIFFSCEYNSKNSSLNLNKKWVYVELEIKTMDDTTDYYYYGQIYERVLDNLAKDEKYESLFSLYKVRYIKHEGEKEKVIPFEDNIDEGTLYFNTRDIVHIEVLKRDPLFKSLKEKVKDSIITKD